MRLISSLFMFSIMIVCPGSLIAQNWCSQCCCQQFEPAVYVSWSTMENPCVEHGFVQSSETHFVNPQSILHSRPILLSQFHLLDVCRNPIAYDDCVATANWQMPTLDGCRNRIAYDDCVARTPDRQSECYASFCADNWAIVNWQMPTLDGCRNRIAYDDCVARTPDRQSECYESFCADNRAIVNWQMTTLDGCRNRIAYDDCVARTPDRQSEC